ncbi:MAG: 4-hydroxy-tetrahydrodipicolinate synthase [Oscillospiraceae bacterium]|jgi:4-hydroxy-tetrahydrodipicolinate synthase|nr:4-hydroxy-tetrahydrodipicolinate synthase [Oscillospiraceae bacterium]
MKNTVFTGSGVALITPFNADMSVNYDEFERLIEFQLENGTDAIFAAVTTSEASTLTHEEHVKVMQRAVEIVHGRVPVVGGTGSNDTAYAIELTQEAEKLGVDATLQVTPYYNKASQAGLIAHFTQIANSTKLPVILYSVPGRTNINILPETCKALSKVENIVAIKEASENISQVSKIAALCGDDLAIYSGCDDLNFPIMALGGKGVISVLANVVPKIAHDIPTLCLNGDYEAARKLQLEWLDLCNGLFIDVNPVPAKTALNMMGYAAGPCRMPLVDMSEEGKAKLQAILQNHGLV